MDSETPSPGPSALPEIPFIPNGEIYDRVFRIVDGEIQPEGNVWMEADGVHEGFRNKAPEIPGPSSNGNLTGRSSAGNTCPLFCLRYGGGPPGIFFLSSMESLSAFISGFEGYTLGVRIEETGGLSVFSLKFRGPLTDEEHAHSCRDFYVHVGVLYST